MEKKKEEKYSVLVPTYQESKNIEPLLTLIMKEAKEHDINLEVVIVDDNSPDGTQDVVKKMIDKFGKDKIILKTRAGKLGLGSAYIFGMEFCSGDLIFLMDADLSHHPKFLHEYIEMQKKTGCDIVTGTRYKPKGGVFGWNLRRKLTSRVANYIASVLLGPKVSDLTGSFRLYKREVLKDLIPRMKSRGYVFQMEAIVRAQYLGYTIEEVPITFVDRMFGSSKLGDDEIIGYLKGLWTLFMDI